MKWIFENSAKLVGSLSFCLLAFSTMHDWGYFSVVGPKLRSIQTTYDYIANAVEWLPALLMVFAFTGGGAALGFAVYDSLWPDEDEGGYFQDRMIRRFASESFRRAIVLSAVGIVLMLVSLPRHGPIVSAVLVMGGAFTVQSLIEGASTFFRTSMRTKEWIVSVRVLFFLLAFVYAWGIADGFNDTKTWVPSKNVYQITVKGDGSRQVSLLRSFEKGILVLDPSRSQVEFFRWEQIEAIGHLVTADHETGSCRLLGLFCSKVPAP